ncbi:MAG: LysM domain-containing protein [Chloroflexi bacterium]|nr:LysM domain-containing protein [Chloroflexota bacterium]
MKPRTILIWFSVLLFSLLSSSTLLAQEDAVAQVSSVPVLFEGTLSSRENTEGSHVTFFVTINAGDQISATALCEAAAEDGNRLIDPALTVFAPGEAGDNQRLQWYNDDEDSAIACVDYRSSFLTFEAPVSGDYEFMIENLANRDGPFSLEILGSTAIQADATPSPEPESETFLVESADEATDAIALTSTTTTTLTFSGTLAAAPNNVATHEVDLVAGDHVVAQLVCTEHNGAYPLDPQLGASITVDGATYQVTAIDDLNGMRCDNDQSSVYAVFSATHTGTYTFTATNQASAQGPYLLTVSGVSVSGGSDSTEPVWDGSDPSVDGSWATAQFSGGEGSLVVNLTAGTTVAALAYCVADDEGNRPANPMLIVRDPSGVVITSADESSDYQSCDSGFSAYVEFTAAVDGLYTFEIVESTDSVRTAAQAMVEEGNPSAITILQILPQVTDDSDSGGGGGGDDGGGGRDCSGPELLGKLGAIGCVFSISTDQGQRIDVYYIDTSSRGHFIFGNHVSQLGNAPGSETQINSGTKGPYTFRAYHRPNGDLRITGGPSSEGKIYEVIVSGLTGASNNNNNDNNDNNNNDNQQSPPAPTYTQYVVQQGDTLYSIATRHGVSVQAIADANGIGADNIIHVGNTLNIPSP